MDDTILIQVRYFKSTINLDSLQRGVFISVCVEFEALSFSRKRAAAIFVISFKSQIYEHFFIFTPEKLMYLLFSASEHSSRQLLPWTPKLVRRLNIPNSTCLVWTSGIFCNSSLIQSLFKAVFLIL